MEAGADEMLYTVPFRLVNDKVVVRAKVNDAAAQDFVLDTGSENTVVSQRTASHLSISPITYTLDGRQYLAVCAGWGGWTAGFAGDGAPWLKNSRRGNTLFVFALPKE